MITELFKELAFEFGVDLGEDGYIPSSLTNVSLGSIEDGYDKLNGSTLPLEKDIESLDTIGDKLIGVGDVFDEQLANLDDVSFTQEYNDPLVRAFTWGILKESLEGYNLPKSMVEDLLFDYEYESKDIDKGKLENTSNKIQTMYELSRKATVERLEKLINGYLETVDNNRLAANKLMADMKSKASHTERTTMDTRGYDILLHGGNFNMKVTSKVLIDVLKGRILPLMKHNRSMLTSLRSGKNIQKYKYFTVDLSDTRQLKYYSRGISIAKVQATKVTSSTVPPLKEVQTVAKTILTINSVINTLIKDVTLPKDDIPKFKNRNMFKRHEVINRLYTNTIIRFIRYCLEVSYKLHRYGNLVLDQYPKH